jgi:hypothetical protein
MASFPPEHPDIPESAAFRKSSLASNLDSELDA